MNTQYLSSESLLQGGRYRIVKMLGSGGFGITYLGMDELHEKPVAIKEFFPQGIVTRNIEYEDTVTVTFVREKENYDKGKERFLKAIPMRSKYYYLPLKQLLRCLQMHSTPLHSFHPLK